MTRNLRASTATAVFGALAVAIAAALGPGAPPASATEIGRGEIRKGEIVALLDRFGEMRLDGFWNFVAEVGGATRNPVLKRAVKRFGSGAALDETDRINIYRLLGIFARLKYRDELIETLGQLVAIPTAKKEGQPQHANPSMHRFGRAIEKIAGRFELDYRNIDNRIFEVTLKGAGDEAIGIFTHGDTVPADRTKWGLPDGRRLAPYILTIIGDRMYGRGASDDKAAIVTALFAMGTIKQEGFPLDRTIRLMIETTEETGGSATEYYKATNQLPAFNLVLDGGYPVGVAEKGFGVVMASFPVRRGSGDGAEIIAATGGLAINQIPPTAEAVIAVGDTSKLLNALDRVAARYVAANGGNFRIRNTASGDRVTVTVFGESTHSAQPERGVNPVSRLFDFLHAARIEVAFRSNHFTDAAAYVADNWGIDYLGNKLGIAYSDPFMGALTAAVTAVGVKDGALRIAVNPRAPRGKEPEQLTAEILHALTAWQKRTGIGVGFEIDIKRYMYRDPKGKWIESLLDIFGDVTGIDAEPRSSAGYTTAGQLPNGIQFGPGMPGEKGTAHRPNEFKKLSNFLRDTQIVIEMMLRLGNLERME